MSTQRPTRACLARGRGAFSLIELVLVVVIIGIVAAIAVPRLSKAGDNAQAVALDATLANVRKAIDFYYAEHGRYPGYDPSNGNPSGPDFVKQLTFWSDLTGKTSDKLAAPYVFGPYLRSPFPANPFSGLNTVRVVANQGTAVVVGSSGWVAVLSTGDFGINADDSKLQEIGVGDTALAKPGFQTKN